MRRPQVGAVVEVLLRELVAPVAEAQVLDRPRQLGLRRAPAAGPSRRPPGARPSRGRGIAAGLGLEEDLAAGGGRAEAVLLTHAHRAGTATNRPGGVACRRVRVLVFHGYLLQRDGLERLQRASSPRRSCARATRSTCSARTATRSRCLGRRRRATGTAARCGSRSAAAPARATVYRPDIGGAAARLRRRPLRRASRRGRSPSSPTRELDAYLARNVAAVREVVERVAARRRAGQPPRDGPGRSSPARSPGAACPTRSRSTARALEYTVKPHPRFLPYAREGLAGAARGPRRARGTPPRACGRRSDDPGLPARTRLGPPGVDVAAFAPARAGRRARGPRRARRAPGGHGAHAATSRPSRATPPRRRAALAADRPRRATGWWSSSAS